MPDRTIIQWDKDDLETLGLLKDNPFSATAYAAEPVRIGTARNPAPISGAASSERAAVRRAVRRDHADRRRRAHPRGARCRELDAARLEALGATRVAHPRQRFWVMQAPTGHRFCLVRKRDRELDAMLTDLLAFVRLAEAAAARRTTQANARTRNPAPPIR